jgi:hypothetical protein
VLGIIVGIVTVVLVASILVSSAQSCPVSGFGPNNIFAYHLNGDPAVHHPAEKRPQTASGEVHAKALETCPSLADALRNCWCQTWSMVALSR